MQVAIFASRNLVDATLRSKLAKRRFLIKEEYGFGLVTRVKFAAHNAHRGKQLYPLDIMLFCHRVRYGAYRYTESSINRFHNRHMLLMSAVGGIAMQQKHRLATTRKNGTFMQDFHYIAT